MHNQANTNNIQTCLIYLKQYTNHINPNIYSFNRVHRSTQYCIQTIRINNDCIIINICIINKSLMICRVTMSPNKHITIILNNIKNPISLIVVMIVNKRYLEINQLIHN